MTKPIITISKAELQKNLCTLSEISKNNEQKAVTIPIENYSSLGFLIDDIIGVCRTALHCYQTESGMNEAEKEKTLGSSVISVFHVLGIVQKLIPHTEMEFLDTLNNTENGND